jgi:NAD-dependent SIR2 family protein deacetylase
MNLKTIENFISQADAVLITAGAGMGVDSGLPDFRGDEGFWRAYPAIKDMNLSFSEMANPSWFESDPFLAWAFYGHRLNLYRQTEPHVGFEMLLNLIKSKNENYFIFTSNVDGQFQKAGFNEEKIYEVHGSIHHLQCTSLCQHTIWYNDESIEVDMEEFRATELINCPNCGAVARPNILMFGDWNWLDERSNNQAQRYQSWLESIRFHNHKLAIIELGAGMVIPTVRVQGERVAKIVPHSQLIRINPREFEAPLKNSIGIDKGAVEGLNLILGEFSCLK